MKQGTIRLPKKQQTTRQFKAQMNEARDKLNKVAAELPIRAVTFPETEEKLHAFGDIDQTIGYIIPSDWHKGQLLNVRNTGADYTITLYPEEYDKRSPERALHFTNPAEAQNFISLWYMREQGGRPW